MTEPRFIVFEGGEGAGKSTQIKRLEAHLHSLSIPVVVTREPGGTPNAEALREIITGMGRGSWSSLSEALIMSAARADHLDNVIRPALAQGQWVLSDRFTMSTNAYQGTGPTGVCLYDLEKLHSLVVGTTIPDLTFLVDIPPSAGLRRAFERGEQSRFERKPIEFHEAVRRSYLRHAGGPNVITLDGMQTPEEIGEEVRLYLAAKFGLPEAAEARDE